MLGGEEREAWGVVVGKSGEGREGGWKDSGRGKMTGREEREEEGAIRGGEVSEKKQNGGKCREKVEEGVNLRVGWRGEGEGGRSVRARISRRKRIRNREGRRMERGKERREEEDDGGGG